MLPKGVKKYLLSGLQGTPDVLDGLLKSLPSEDPRWNVQPDPDRFSLREVLAHLADWEPIFRERVQRIAGEENPFLPNVDEEQLAIDRDYAHSDGVANLARFREGRAILVATLHDLKDTDWDRIGDSESLGRITATELATLILGHDGYHTQQVAQWLASAGA